MNKNNFTFIFIMLLMTSLFILFGFFCLYLTQISSLVLYRIFLNIILIAAFLIGLFMLTSMILIMRTFKHEKISAFQSWMIKLSMAVIYPNILSICGIIGIDKDRVRKVFSDINNQLILSKTYHIAPEQILILIPHCLQKKECPHKITSEIENCKRCGLCDVDRLIMLKEKHSVQLFVATGGTIARKIVQETQPKAIIAVACERDLSSGIQEVRGIPVIGIVNERPEGPCVNTRVSIKKIEDCIKYLKGEGEL
ncbi:hypothetical protein Gferi_01700 [Geosporobacter ferrireducens]|uniref:DUF116 domain-containing protein n=2 Tax=Geosporobacter ferrireducens TaxID=1424294 RepID=A0A1D8GPW6_9FIRM|nr:hypothetical protein Gferi_01700 [Geosporobacter ferrireducens]